MEPYGTWISQTHRRTNDDAVLTPLASAQEYASWKQRQQGLLHELDGFQSRLAAVEKSARDRCLGDRKSTERPTSAEIDKAMTAPERSRIKNLKASIARLENGIHRAPFPRALSVRECGLPLKKTHVLIRGNATALGKKVEPRLLTILGGRQLDVSAPAFHESSRNAAGTRSALSELGIKPTLGLRRQLALSIIDKDNPLTARVMVNRLWQYHFGRGIVRTVDNFGRAGTPPTHPDLLAWLARDLMDGDWQLKRLHKLILMSNAYKMSSAVLDSRAQAADPDNDLFWRQNLHRLDAEAIRDAVLAVSGRLNLSMGGRGIFPKLSQEVLATQSRPGLGWGHSSAEDESRRSVYIYLKRTLMVPFLETFDYSNTAEPVGDRPVTTVAPQALLMLNSEFTFEQAAALAARLRREAGDDVSESNQSVVPARSRAFALAERIDAGPPMARLRARRAGSSAIVLPRGAERE